MNTSDDDQESPGAEFLDQKNLIVSPMPSVTEAIYLDAVAEPAKNLGSLIVYKPKIPDKIDHNTTPLDFIDHVNSLSAEDKLIVRRKFGSFRDDLHDQAESCASRASISNTLGTLVGGGVGTTAAVSIAVGSAPIALPAFIAAAFGYGVLGVGLWAGHYFKMEKRKKERRAKNFEEAAAEIKV